MTFHFFTKWSLVFLTLSNIKRFDIWSWNLYRSSLPFPFLRIISFSIRCRRMKHLTKLQYSSLIRWSLNVEPFTFSFLASMDPAEADRFHIYHVFTAGGAICKRMVVWGFRINSHGIWEDFLSVYYQNDLKWFVF